MKKSDLKGLSKSDQKRCRLFNDGVYDDARFTFGEIWCGIGDYCDNGYFQLCAGCTFSAAKDIDCNKNFKTVANALDYYKKQVKKILEKSLKEMEG